MIDLQTENLIPVLDTLKLVPISLPTLRRLTASGKLETVKVGARIFTSTAAIQRMLLPGPQLPHAAPLPPTRKQQKRQDHLARVDAELDAMFSVSA